QGQYRSDLSDYWSIQHDFPNVYGIGPDGLPDSATLQRKAQALQLKGYLLFFDQLLADYLAQLAQLRVLFSLRPESERSAAERRSYFSQIPASTPNIEKLIRFYDRLSGGGVSTAIAEPVFNDAALSQALRQLEKNTRTALTIKNDVCGAPTGLVEHFYQDSAVLRSALIRQLSETFAGGNFTIDIQQDKYGCFFLLRPQQPAALVLIGTQRYPSAIAAREAAEQAAFLAALADNFVLNSREGAAPNGNDRHLFVLAYQPLAYLRFLQEMLEDENLYLRRRQAFLDHLLSRFAEQFTDFSLLQYQANQPELDNRRALVEKQSLFLSEYEDTGRNRGKAFDYFLPAWNTENVSGFEKRVQLLAGIEQWRRRNLCNFEVTPCMGFRLPDYREQILFSSNLGNVSAEQRFHTAKNTLEKLSNPANYPDLERRLEGFQKTAVHRLFSQTPAAENLPVASHHYRLELLDAGNNPVKISADAKMSSAAKAEATIPDFIKNIDRQTTPAGRPTTPKMRLIPLEKPGNRYLDTAALPLDIRPILRWNWEIADGRTELRGERPFESAEAAWAALAEQKQSRRFLRTEKEAWRWKFSLLDTGLHWTGRHWFPDKNQALAAFRVAIAAGRDPKNYRVQFAPDKKSLWFELYRDASTRLSSTAP
ncbi:MAG: hypothetical protein JNK89_01535, partial [Saprospiraceae bacterium]|nr:hypothetical protein [Saprospiraceae bacterium]